MDLKRDKKAVEQDVGETKRALEDIEEERRKNEEIAKRNEELAKQNEELANNLKQQLEMEKKKVEATTTEVFKEGWLQKKSKDTIGYKFQKRWVILKGNSLSVYNKDSDDRSKPLSSHFLDSIRVYTIPGEVNVFEIRWPNDTKSKPLTFSASTEEEKKIWCKLLQSVKAQQDTKRQVSAGP